MTANITDVLICVGGPCDGRRVEIDRDRQRIAIQQAHPIPLNWQPPYAHCHPPKELNLHVYTRITYRAGDEVRWMLTPDGQSFETTLALLLAGYRRPRE